MEYHVIPVPRGYDPMDAWWEIEIFGELKAPWWRRIFGLTWASIEVDDA
jgi:hypothetical protein